MLPALFFLSKSNCNTPYHSPYSKMAAILVFLCFLANWPIWPPRFQTWNSKEYSTLNEAKRDNLLSNKRILKWRPFGNKVYGLALRHTMLHKGIIKLLAVLLLLKSISYSSVVHVRMRIKKHLKPIHGLLVPT